MPADIFDELEAGSPATATAAPGPTVDVFDEIDQSGDLFDQLDYAPEPEKRFFDAGDAVSGIWDAVRGLGATGPAAFYQLVEGMERPDRYSESAKKAFADADAYNQEIQAKMEQQRRDGTATSVGESFREAGTSLGFSGASMAAAIPASIAGTALGAKIGAGIGAAAGAPAAGVGAAPGAAVGATAGGIIGGATAAMASAGTAAYRMAGANFLKESFDALNEKSLKENGREMNEAEREESYKALLPIAQNTALWEAGPEAVSNAVMLGAGKIALNIGKPLFKTIAGSAMKRIGAAGAGVVSEVAGETVTHIEQEPDQQKMQQYVAGQPMTAQPDWSAEGIAESFKQVAPQTLALTVLMGAGGGVIKAGDTIINADRNRQIKEARGIVDGNSTNEDYRSIIAEYSDAIDRNDQEKVTRLGRDMRLITSQAHATLARHGQEHDPGEVEFWNEYMDADRLAREETERAARMAEAGLPESASVLAENAELRRQEADAKAVPPVVSSAVIPNTTPKSSVPASGLYVMSQQEYAEWLKQNGAQRSQAQVYDELTRKRSLRGVDGKDLAAQVTARRPEFKAYQESVNQHWSGKRGATDGVSAIGADSSWVNYQINNGTGSNSESHKAYLTFNDLVTDFSQAEFDTYLTALRDAGFQGQVKIAPTGSRATFSFDNIVAHGATEADAKLAEAVGRKTFGGKISETMTGQDKSGTSHTDALATEVFDAQSSRGSRASQTTSKTPTDVFDELTTTEGGESGETNQGQSEEEGREEEVAVPAPISQPTEQQPSAQAPTVLAETPRNPRASEDTLQRALKLFQDEASATGGKASPATLQGRLSITIDEATEIVEELRRRGQVDFVRQDGRARYVLRSNASREPVSPGPAAVADATAAGVPEAEVSPSSTGERAATPGVDETVTTETPAPVVSEAPALEGVTFQGKKMGLLAFLDNQTGGNFSIKETDLPADPAERIELIRQKRDAVRESFTQPTATEADIDRLIEESKPKAPEAEPTLTETDLDASVVSIPEGARGYKVKFGNATGTVEEYADRIELKDLVSLDQGKGQASKVIDALKAKGKPVTLIAGKRSGDTVKPEFYTKRGFVPVEGKPGAYRWEPAKPEPKAKPKAEAPKPAATPEVEPDPVAPKKNRLELLMDGVERTGKEVTIEITDANRENLTRIIDAAKARGLRSSTDGRNVLIQPAVEPSRLATEVLTSSDRVRVTAPTGATFLRVTPAKGAPIIESIKNVDSGGKLTGKKGMNVLQGVGPFTKIEAGTMGGKGGKEFVAIKGDVTVTDAREVQASRYQSSTPARAGVTVVKGETHLQNVVRVVEALKRSIKGIRVRVLRNEGDLPQDVRDKLKPGVRHEGLTDVKTGDVWIFSDHIANSRRAAEVFAHEVIGHHGVEKVVDAKEWQSIANQIFKQHAAEAARIGRLYFDEETPFDPTNEDHRRLVAKEYIARLAENPGKAPNLWKRIVTAVKAALRKMGIRREWSDDEIRDLIRQAGKAVERGVESRTGELFGARSYWKEADAAYLKAIESGDMETAQRLVDEAAAKAGYRQEMYHGTNETEYVPGTTTPGDKQALSELNAYADKHGLSGRPMDVANIFERWVSMGMAEEQGITPEDAIRARELVTRARGESTPGREAIGFSVFNIPAGELELGVHLGNKGAASMFGEPFRFFSNADNLLRLPDLGTWNYQNVMREARKAGVPISESEYDDAFNATDNNKAVRELLKSKGYDGIVYENEAEGRGDSFIVFDPNQIKSADPITRDDQGRIIPLSERFNQESPDLRFARKQRDPKLKAKDIIIGKLTDEDFRNHVRDLWATKFPDTTSTSQRDLEAALFESIKGDWDAQIEAFNASKGYMDRLRQSGEMFRYGGSDTGRVEVAPLGKLKDEIFGQTQTPEGKANDAGGTSAGGPSVGRDLLASRVDQTSTPAFKAWFGDSKVVDENGEPLVVYKGMMDPTEDDGTPRTKIERGTPFPAFDPTDTGGDVKLAGFFAEDPKVADRFATLGRNKDGAVFPVFLKIERPYIVDAADGKAGVFQFGKTGKPFRDAMRSGKYDGAIIRNTSDEGTIYIPIEATQIKSATGNAGTFDASNPSILASRVDDGFTTGTKEEVRQAERAARGLDDIVKDAKQSNQETFDKATALLAANPGHGKAIIAGLLDGSKTDVSEVDEAVMLGMKVETMKQRDAAADLLDKPDLSPAERAEAQARWTLLENDINAIDQATTRSGTVWGRLGQFRQRLMRQDMSFEALQRKARVTLDRPLNPDEVKLIKEQADQIAELQRRVAELEASKDKDGSDAAADDEVKKLKGKSHKAKPVTPDSIRDKMKARIDKGASITDLRGYVQKLALEFVRQGTTERQSLVFKVHAVLLTLDPAIDRRTTQDLISGYGDFKPLDMETSKVTLRDIKAQLQQTGKMDDIIAGLPLQKTGVQRQAPSDKTRRLIQKVNELKKKHGVVTTDPETQLKSAQDAIRTRLSNQIKDIANILETGERPPTKTPLEYDQQNERLRDILDRARKTLAEIEGKPEMTDAERAKITMRALEGQIGEYERRLRESDTSPRNSPKRLSTPEIDAMRARRDALRAEYQEMEAIDYDLQQARNAKRNASEEARLKVSITELDARLSAGDLEARANPSREVSAAVERLRAERKAMQGLLTQLRNESKPKMTAEERSLKALKARLANLAAEIKEKLAMGDFEKKARPEIKPDAETLNLRAELQMVKNQYNRALLDKKLAERKLPRRIFDKGVETLNTSRAILTSMDFSGVLRQGGAISLAHPVRAAKIIPTMMRAFGLTPTAIRAGKAAAAREIAAGRPLRAAIESAKAMGAYGEKASLAAMEELKSRPNWDLYGKAKLEITDENADSLSKMEEQFASRWGHMIPGVAGSARAYTTFLNVLRADSFDAMIKAFPGGNPTIEEANAIANYINVATGRGALSGKYQTAAAGLNSVFFAPKYVLSRFQMLGLQPFMRGSRETRKAIAGEYARYLIGIGTVMGLAALAQDDDDPTIETDPRSSEFMKVRFGDTRLDAWSGLIQPTVLMSRLATGETKAASGQTIPLRGQDIPYGGATSADVMARFLRTKLAPAPGAMVNLLSGENVVGEEVTTATAARDFLVPINFGEILDVMKDQGVPKGTALSLLSMFGFGLQEYSQSARRKEQITDRLEKKGIAPTEEQIEFEMKASEYRRQMLQERRKLKGE
jgi:hypothetical protein